MAPAAPFAPRPLADAKTDGRPDLPLVRAFPPGRTVTLPGAALYRTSMAYDGPAPLEAYEARP